MAKYQAFLSYAHADENIAQRVHKSLETFPIPQALKTQGKLSPIFRDVTELTAHHSLSDKIRDAVQNSRFLIVLCSPSSKTSHWVNEEIRLFRQLHGEDSILCALIEGSPKTSFPPALTEGGREPLAADMTGQKESFKFGITQMAASMLGVGLDELVQREAKRRRRRLQFITAGALGFAAIMGGMAWTAVDARDAAEVSRTEAEKMVEFMITDLKDELEPVGRLSILDDVGTRVTNYYDAIPLSDMDDDRLARQARARHLLGQVALDQGTIDRAKTEVQASYEATQEILRRNPDNTEALFVHAQSAYWMGAIHHYIEEFETTLKYWKLYNQYGQHLYQREPSNIDWIMEAAWGENNLANANVNLDDFTAAKDHFENSIKYFKKSLEIAPHNVATKYELANALAGASEAAFYLNDHSNAIKFRTNQINILDALVTSNQNNNIYPYRLHLARSEEYFLKLAISQTNCTELEGSVLLNAFSSYMKADPTNRRIKRDFIHFKFKLFENCYQEYNSIRTVDEAKNLVSLLQQIDLVPDTTKLKFLQELIAKEN